MLENANYQPTVVVSLLARSCSCSLSRLLGPRGSPTHRIRQPPHAHPGASALTPFFSAACADSAVPQLPHVLLATSCTTSSSTLSSMEHLRACRNRRRACYRCSARPASHEWWTHSTRPREPVAEAPQIRFSRASLIAVFLPLACGLVAVRLDFRTYSRNVVAKQSLA